MTGIRLLPAKFVLILVFKNVVNDEPAKFLEKISD